ncbi:MAG: stage III sporulation AC/AD family protein [Christensenellaceae bacterium]|jgi:stage III sporulation protein AD|nr:stage III sporulation AC/AD family protein [Christensenellaceae bacterium]
MIIKVVIIGIIGTIVVGMLKQLKPELSILATIATGIAILVMVINELSIIHESFLKFSEKTTGSIIFPALMKVIGIGYLTEYASSICDDYGSNSLSKKVQFAGKVGILIIALPNVIAIMDAIGAILE